jgi:hypothetical protein
MAKRAAKKSRRQKSHGHNCYGFHRGRVLSCSFGDFPARFGLAYIDTSIFVGQQRKNLAV